MGGRKPEPNLLADVNARIRDVADRSVARSDVWEFMCECGCEQRVMLTLEAYEQMMLDGTSVLVPGHEVTPAARAKALCEDARALTAQATQQVARAKTNKRA
ncbi:MAG TPA: hypothetical protein VGH92_10245 [Gaiellaceae bacterium]